MSLRDARAAHRRASFRIRTYDCPEGRGVHVTNQEKGGHVRD